MTNASRSRHERLGARGAFLAFAVVLAHGCGGARAPSPSANVPRHDATLSATIAPSSAPVGDSEGTSAPGTSADRVALPGTGVSMMPPMGASPMRIGAGFLGARRELEIVIAIADDAATLEEIAAYGADGLHPETESVTIDGRAAQLVTDGYEENGEAIERVWFFVRDGARGLAIVGEYDASESTHLRAQVRESLLSTQWDAHVALDPESAAGYRVGAPAQLVVRAEVVNGLSYAPRGESATIDSGEPTILVAPLDVEVPRSEQAEDCAMLLMLSGPVAADTVVRDDTFETDDARGCEVFGEEVMDGSREGGSLRLATYAAVVFLDEEAFVVAGIVDAREGSRWTPRFGAAARSLTWVAR